MADRPRKYEFELTVEIEITDKYVNQAMDEYKDLSDIEAEDISIFSGKLRDWLNDCVKTKGVEMVSYSLRRSEEESNCYCDDHNGEEPHR